MIALPLQILIAIILDALWGDPRWLPHPVQAMAALATRLETPLRRAIGNARVAGAVGVIIVVSATAACAALLLWAAGAVHPLLGDVMAILMLYTTIALRSLTQHARAVQRPLQNNDLLTARKRVAWLVGRDTERLDEAEIARASVESVAENCVDGVTAPLLFALCGGPVAALVYKAINTLDSTFGYKNERYINFGWAAARLDDAANFIPARLTALMVPPAALLAGFDAAGAWRIWRRDRHRHPSPNGGQIEAAMAGALHVRLGGSNSYFGKNSFRPYLGDCGPAMNASHIGAVIQLMWITAALTFCVAITTGWLLA